MVTASPTPSWLVAAKYVTRRAPGMDGTASELTISPDSSECCAACRNTWAPTALGKRTRRFWTWLRPPSACHTRS